MREGILRKGLVVGIIMLFLGASVVSGFNTNSNPKPSSRGWLYVGGSGPGNYSKIQDAINNASNGDTVFVYNGTYMSNIIVDRTINLVGENRNTTFIDGQYGGNGINLFSEWVNITGFTIFNCSYGIYGIYTSNNTIINCDVVQNLAIGIHLFSSPNNRIIECNVSSNGYDGIRFEEFSMNCEVINSTIIDNDNEGIFSDSECNHTNVIGCNVSNNADGIYLYSSNSIVDNNIVLNNYLGVQIGAYSSNSVVTNCIISNNIEGVFIEISDNNTISRNYITYNNLGIHPEWRSYDNRIYNNNFINNAQNAYDEFGNFFDNGYQSGGNYWSDYTGEDNNNDGIGDTPYVIPGGTTQDFYPLMYPYEMYMMLDIILQNISINESEVFLVEVRSLGGRPIFNAEVTFDNQTYTTDDNGTTWITAPGVETDTYYEITANKDGYIGANETILVRNIPTESGRAFFLGTISNLTIHEDYLTFNAVNIRVTTFSPFSRNIYTSDEEFIISHDFLGRIIITSNNILIIVLGEILI